MKQTAVSTLRLHPHHIHTNSQEPLPDYSKTLKKTPPLQIGENVLTAARLLNDLFWLCLSMYMVLCCSNSFRSLRISQIQVTSFFSFLRKVRYKYMMGFFVRSFITYYCSTFPLYVAHCSHMYPMKSWKFSPFVIKSSILCFKSAKETANVGLLLYMVVYCKVG